MERSERQQTSAIELRSLGDCVIQVGSKRISSRARVTFAVLLRLLAQAGQAIPRSEIQSLLWPSESDPNARHRLRQVIYGLKRLGVKLAGDSTHVTLIADRAAVDYRDAIVNCHSDCSPLLRVFLPGFAPNISPAFERWLQELRSHVDLQILRALLSVLAPLRQNGRWSEVEAVASRCLDIDPLNEEATLSLAEARAMGGNKVEAVRLIDRYKEDLDIHAPGIGLPSSLLRERIAGRLLPAESPLVGRESTIAAIATVVRNLGNVGGGYLITGDAGCGKTRIIQEIHRIAVLGDLAVVQAECLPGDARYPLSILTRIIPAVQGLPGAIGCSPHSLEYLRRLTDEPTEATHIHSFRETPSFTYTAIKRSIDDLVAAVTHELSLLLIIDDIDQADELSIEIIGDLIAASRSKSLLILMTARHLSGSVARLTTAGRGLRWLALNPLGQSDAGKLLQSLTSAHHGGLSEELEALYVEMADGNPFSIHELARYWESCGQLRPIPPSIESILHNRIAGLAERDLGILQTTVLLGHNATTERLSQLLELSQPDLLNHLESLEQAGFARWEQNRLRCSHRRLAELACERLSSTALLSIHSRIAKLLNSELTQPDCSGLLWDCANHFRLAGKHNESIALLSKCSDRLLRLGVPHEATSLWRQALDLCQSDAERIVVQEKLISALHAAGDLAQVSRAAEEVIRLRKSLRLGNSGWSDWQIDVLEARMYALQDVEPILVEASACLSDEFTAPHIRVRAGICAMICAYNLHEPTRVAYINRLLTSLMDEVTFQPVDRLTMSLVFNTYVGDLEKGAAAGNELVDLARTSGSVALLAQSLRRYAVVLRMLGQFKDARRALNEAYQLAKWMDSRSYMLATRLLIAQTLIEQGDLDAARELLSRTITPDDRRRFPYRAIIVAHLRAMIALIDGNQKEAMRVCDSRAFRKWRARSSQLSGRMRHDSLAVSALLSVSRETVARSKKQLAALEHEFTRLQEVGDQDFVAFALCKSLIARGQGLRAQTIVADYLRLHRRERYPAPEYLTNLLKPGPGQVSNCGSAKAAP
jgi:DNA-binding SARP family transcriptional activator/tetratricopeptide (TPR) repeat protein